MDCGLPAYLLLLLLSLNAIVVGQWKVLIWKRNSSRKQSSRGNTWVHPTSNHPGGEKSGLTFELENGSQKYKWLKNIVLKKCSSFLAIREKKIKTFLRYHVNPVRMAEIEARKSNKCWESANPHTLPGVHIGSATMEINVTFSRETRNRSTF